MIHLRTLTYTTTKSNLASLEGNEQFNDLAEVGSMLNAIVHASEIAPWQLASFTSDRDPVNETIYLTGSLIYESILNI